MFSFDESLRRLGSSCFSFSAQRLFSWRLLRPPINGEGVCTFKLLFIFVSLLDMTCKGIQSMQSKKKQKKKKQIVEFILGCLH